MRLLLKKRYAKVRRCMGKTILDVATYFSHVQKWFGLVPGEVRWH